jgi:hypothetical protein
VPSDSDVAHLTGLRGRFNSITLVLFDEAAPLLNVDELRWRTGTLIRVDAGAAFKDVWNNVMALPSTGAHLRVRSDTIRG